MEKLINLNIINLLVLSVCQQNVYIGVSTKISISIRLSYINSVKMFYINILSFNVIISLKKLLRFLYVGKKYDSLYFFSY